MAWLYNIMWGESPNKDDILTQSPILVDKPCNEKSHSEMSSPVPVNDDLGDLGNLEDLEDCAEKISYELETATVELKIYPPIVQEDTKKVCFGCKKSYSKRRYAPIQWKSHYGLCRTCILKKK